MAAAFSTQEFHTTLDAAASFSMTMRRRQPRPQIALPATDPHKAEIVELDISIMAFADVPEQHRLAEAIIGRLCKGAGAGYHAAAVVEPVADDMPVRNVAHPGSPVGCDAADYSQACRHCPSVFGGIAPERGERQEVGEHFPQRHDLGHW
jgi:hypothetical protein